jgi:hypothetical protein
VPGEFTMTRGSDGKTAFQVLSNLGCREAPLSISAANLSADQGQQGPIIVSRSPEDHAALETQLAKIRDGGTCPKLGAELFACEGTRPTPTGAKERVVYLIAVDSGLVQSTGGPLRARCLFPEGKPLCTVTDDLAGEVRYESAIPGPPTLAAIIAQHKQARAYVDSIRVSSR